MTAVEIQVRSSSMTSVIDGVERRCARAIACLCALALIVACGSAPPQEAPLRGPAPTRPSADQIANAERLLTGPDWYRHAVFYEVNVRSFQDSNGDGIGDLAGLMSRLDYWKDLGVDALWLMPIFPTGRTLATTSPTIARSILPMEISRLMTSWCGKPTRASCACSRTSS